MRNFLIVLFILLIIGGAALAPYWIHFQQQQGVVPAGVRLGGLDVGGPDPDTVTAEVNRMFDEPIAVYYEGQRIVLRPQMVGFRTDVTAMLADAHAVATPINQIRVFAAEMIGRPTRPIDVPLRYVIDSDMLDNWLTDVASRYDRPPMPPQPIVDKLTIAPGQPGTQLDLTQSRVRLIATLTNPNVRSVDLVVREAAPPPVDLKALGDLMKARLDEFPGPVASLFLHDITTGEEININGDVAYAGMSTMKIAILEELYRKLDAPPDAHTQDLINQTTQLSGNYTANILLSIVGAGDVNEGVRIFNQSLHNLGLKNTFMAAPYDTPTNPPPHIVTGANSRKDLNTNPDPYIQTTPRDMGLMLSMIVECSRGGGTLLAAYPGQLTQEECQRALNDLSLNEVHELLTAGVPAGTKVIHKHGYAADTHGDVAVIYGPTGPYVLSVYYYDPPWMEWAISNPTMIDLSKAAWNYFSSKAAEQQATSSTGS
jgi:beta-lactamase class A